MYYAVWTRVSYRYDDTCSYFKLMKISFNLIFVLSQNCPWIRLILFIEQTSYEYSAHIPLMITCLLNETEKTEVPCDSRCGTIKIPPRWTRSQTPSIILNYEALFWNWCILSVFMFWKTAEDLVCLFVPLLRFLPFQGGRKRYTSDKVNKSIKI